MQVQDNALDRWSRQLGNQLLNALGIPQEIRERATRAEIALGIDHLPIVKVWCTVLPATGPEYKVETLAGEWQIVARPVGEAE